MTVIIFIILLAVLILVHEFGHFVVAKWSGMRVDEFGLGLPPRAITLFKKDETEYTLNWIPFGGFVKIHGEDMEATDEDGERSFSSKPARFQAAVLVAGVACNILFAWLLFSVGFMAGMPTSVDGISQDYVENEQIIITGVLEDTEAQEAGIASGDVIVSLSSDNEILEGDDLTLESVRSFIASSQSGFEVEVLREDISETVIFSTTDEPERVIGVMLATIGTVTLPPHKAIIEGGRTTALLLKNITIGFGYLIYDSVRGDADLGSIAGPVGIVGLVGDASSLGFIYLLSFAAFISLNLAVLNLVPFPALDGGRLLFVFIEKIKGSPIKPRTFRLVNGVGFGILLLLMIVVTINDIVRLF